MMCVLLTDTCHETAFFILLFPPALKFAVTLLLYPIRCYLKNPRSRRQLTGGKRDGRLVSLEVVQDRPWWPALPRFTRLLLCYLHVQVIRILNYLPVMDI